MVSGTAVSSNHHEALTKAVFSSTLRGRAAHFAWLYGKNAGRAIQALRNRGAIDRNTSEIGNRLKITGLEIGAADTYLTAEGTVALQQSIERIYHTLETEEVQSVLQEGVNEKQGKDYLIHMLPAETRHDGTSPFLKLALDPKLLEIVSVYFGMWPKLHSIGSWLNFPIPEEAKKSQLWHRDPADLMLLKVFIYLEPVDERNGPFSFIPETQPLGAASDIVPRHEHRRRITDEEMAKAFPEDKWVKCVGPAKTMVMADTVGFHRGGKVDEGRRLLITLTYTSGSPQEARELHVTEVPDWATHPIQKSALVGVVDR